MNRYVGDRIVTWSGETKPTNVLDGAILLETGYANSGVRNYYKMNGVWIEILSSGSSGGGAATGDYIPLSESGRFVNKYGNESITGLKSFVNNLGLGGNFTPQYKLHISGDGSASESIAFMGPANGVTGFEFILVPGTGTLQYRGGSSMGTMKLSSTAGSPLVLAANNASVRIDPGPFDGLNTWEFNQFTMTKYYRDDNDTGRFPCVSIDAGPSTTAFTGINPTGAMTFSLYRNGTARTALKFGVGGFSSSPNTTTVTAQGFLGIGGDFIPQAFLHITGINSASYALFQSAGGTGLTFSQSLGTGTITSSNSSGDGALLLGTTNYSPVVIRPNNSVVKIEPGLFPHLNRWEFQDTSLNKFQRDGSNTVSFQQFALTPSWIGTASTTAATGQLDISVYKNASAIPVVRYGTNATSTPESFHFGNHHFIGDVNITGSRSLNVSGVINSSGANFTNYVNLSGERLALVRISGSNALPVANFTGAGSVTVTQLGSIVLISGSPSTGGGGGVLTGDYLLTSESGRFVNKYSDESVTGRKTFINNTTFNENINLSGAADISYISSYGELALTTSGGSFNSIYVLPLGLNTGNYWEYNNDKLNKYVSNEFGGEVTMFSASPYVHNNLDGFSTGGFNLSTYKNDVESVLVQGYDSKLNIFGENRILNSDTFNYLVATGNYDGYQQINISNKRASQNASSDFIATMDIGNESNYYVNLGINSSQYSGSEIGYTGDAYLYSKASNLYIGNRTSGQKLYLFSEVNPTGNNAEREATAIITNQNMTINGVIELNAKDFGRNEFQEDSSLDLFNRNLANKSILYLRGNYEYFYGVGPAMWSKHIQNITTATTTSQTTYGCTATNLGTLSHIASQYFGYMTNYATAATQNVQAGTSFNVANLYRGNFSGQNGFFLTSRFAFPDATGLYTSGIVDTGVRTGVRFFFGASDQALTTVLAANNAAGSRVGFSLIRASGGTQSGFNEQNFFFVTKGVTDVNRIDTQLPFNSGLYQGYIFCPPYPNTGSIYWELRNLSTNTGVSGMASFGSALPAANTALRPMIGIHSVSGAKNFGTTCLYSEV